MSAPPTPAAPAAPVAPAPAAQPVAQSFFPLKSCVALFLALLILPVLGLIAHGQLLLRASDLPLPAMSRRELVQLYNDYGEMFDLVHFHKEPALRELSRRCGFRKAMSVLEIGPGTGAYAEQLLSDELPGNATYEGYEASKKMFHLAAARLASRINDERVCLRLRTSDARDDDMAMGASRASKHQTARLGWRGFDRFVSAFVFDKLSPAEIKSELAYAHAELAKSGRVCVITLSRGKSLLGQGIASIWQALYSLAPGLVGGARPINFAAYVPLQDWVVTNDIALLSAGVPMQIVILRKQTNDQALE